MGLILYPEPFDFSLPSRRELALMPGADVLPYGLVVATMVRRNRPFFSAMRLLRAATDLPIYQLSAPPPSNDPSGVSKFIHRAGNRHKVAPFELRYKLWQVHTDTVKTFCMENDITFVPCPLSTLDQNGFLEPSLSAGDGVHGNSEYGARVLTDVLPRLGVVSDGASLQRTA